MNVPETVLRDLNLLSNPDLEVWQVAFQSSKCIDSKYIKYLLFTCLSSSGTQIDQDRSPRRAPRPRHHLPVGRGGRNRPDGARHPRSHPPIASATAMRVTAIQTQTERKPQDRSVRHAEERRRRARMLRVRSLIRPTSGVCGTADTARGEKRLFIWHNQEIFPSSGRPLGECWPNWVSILSILNQGRSAFSFYTLRPRMLVKQVQTPGAIA